MPQLKEGTTLWTYQFPENAYYTGAALAAQLNWTYTGTGYHESDIDYDFILINSGQNYMLPGLIPNQAFDSSNRNYTFHGNTSNTVYLFKESNNCLRVLDSDLVPALGVVSEYNNTMIDAAALSNLELIGGENGKPAKPIVQIVGNEPPHGWCYYFEKAELAWQQNDYSGVLTLYAEAQSLGLSPNSSTEWYAYIDALGRTGNWTEAQTLTKTVAADGRIPLIGVCNIWNRFAKDYKNEDNLLQKINGQLNELGCN
jgi:hypothetical protein